MQASGITTSAIPTIATSAQIACNNIVMISSIYQRTSAICICLGWCKCVHVYVGGCVCGIIFILFRSAGQKFYLQHRRHCFNGSNNHIVGRSAVSAVCNSHQKGACRCWYHSFKTTTRVFAEYFLKLI